MISKEEEYNNGGSSIVIKARLHYVTLLYNAIYR